jgi:hypothetical protein
MTPKKIQLNKTDFKAVQQDATELNGDGNRTRGRYGEDLSEEVVHDKCGTPECCQQCDTAEDGESSTNG